MKGMVRTFGSLYPSSGSIVVSSAIFFYLIEAERLKRNSEDIRENLHLTKNTVVLLKKEIAQKTEALNKALKRESEMKVSKDIYLTHNHQKSNIYNYIS